MPPHFDEFRTLAPMTTTQLLDRVAGLSDGVKRDVFVPDESGTLTCANKFSAVCTPAGKNYVRSITSPRYEIVQHKTAFKSVVDSVRLVTDNVVAAVRESPAGVATMYIGIPALTKTAPDGQSITFGLSVRNSYDGKSSFFIGGFGYRQVCSNGMVFVKNFKGARLIHLVGISSAVEQYLENVETGISRLFELISRARERECDVEQTKLLLKGLSRHRQILAQFETEEQNEWGLYNAATFVISRSTTANAQTEFHSLVQAEKILDGRRHVAVGGPF